MNEDLLNPEKLKALSNETRLEIIELLRQEPNYPAAVARELDISKQKAHYHFNQLKNTDIITETTKEGKSNCYKLKASRLVYGTEAENSKLLQQTFDNQEGLIVVGAPDTHGEDQVRARDGHLAGEIGLKLGRHRLDFKTVWDTKVVRDKLFDENMVIIGGILTNTVAKKFNSEFPAYFSGDSFPYREIKTPESTFTDPDIGIIARKENKIMIAGVRNTGTEAAAKAFQKEDFEKNYLVVKGLDLDGDGEIDDYEVVE